MIDERNLFDQTVKIDLSQMKTLKKLLLVKEMATHYGSVTALLSIPHPLFPAEFVTAFITLFFTTCNCFVKQF